MSGDAKTAIVDFIMQRPISEIDTTSDDVNERLITLECGHIFMVGTLDGCRTMPEYYEIDPMTGHYITMNAPPNSCKLERGTSRIGQSIRGKRWIEMLSGS